MVGVKETAIFSRVARAAKRPVMWALPVLRTRGYLAAVEFHAHAASLGSLSPCDLYLVNLGSVVRCETSIRTPPSRATVILRTSSAAAPALERKRWLAVVGAVAKGIRRMRDLYRAGGGGAGCGDVRKRWQLPSTPGVILPQATAARATYQASQFFLSTAPHATHSLSPCQHEKSPLINYCFLLQTQQSPPRSRVIYT